MSVGDTFKHSSVALIYSADHRYSEHKGILESYLRIYNYDIRAEILHVALADGAMYYSMPMN